MILFISFLLISLLLIYIFRVKLFAVSVGSSGFGTYSDPVYTQCISESGGCDVNGKRKAIRYCIPTNDGKGCIDDKGYQTFQNSVIEEVCFVQCRKSIFDIQIDEKCNKLVDDKGIDLSYFYLSSVPNSDVFEDNNGPGYGPYNFWNNIDPPSTVNSVLLQNQTSEKVSSIPFNYELTNSFLKNEPYVASMNFSSDVNKVFVSIVEPDYSLPIENYIFTDENDKLTALSSIDDIGTKDFYNFTYSGNTLTVKYKNTYISATGGHYLELYSLDSNGTQISLTINNDRTLSHEVNSTTEDVYFSDKGTFLLLTSSQFNFIQAKSPGVILIKVVINNLIVDKDISVPSKIPCIPSSVQGYRQKYYKCIAFDDSGLNGCNYTCGVDTNSLKPSYSGYIGVNAEIIDLYPISPFFPDGSVRECLDYKGVDQLAPLNLRNFPDFYNGITYDCEGEEGKKTCTKVEGESPGYQYDLEKCKPDTCWNYDSSILDSLPPDNKTAAILNSNQPLVTTNNFIFPEKCYSRDSKLILDLTYFRTPIIRNPDGTYIPGCTTQGGAPLSNGTQIQLTPGQTLIVNLPCNDYPGVSKCGEWLSVPDDSRTLVKPSKCNQSGFPNFTNDCNVIENNPGNMTELNKLFSPGFNTLPLFCFKNEEKTGFIFWDSTKTFEKGDVVFSKDDGLSYIALSHVPKGKKITDEGYWKVDVNCLYDENSYLSSYDSPFTFFNSINTVDIQNTFAKNLKQPVYKNNERLECIERCVFYENSNDKRLKYVDDFITKWTNSIGKSYDYEVYKGLFNSLFILESSAFGYLTLNSVPCNVGSKIPGNYEDTNSDPGSELYSQSVVFSSFEEEVNSGCGDIVDSSISKALVSKKVFANSLLLIIVPIELVEDNFFQTGLALKCNILCIFGKEYFGYLGFSGDENELAKPVYNGVGQSNNFLFFSQAKFNNHLDVDKVELIDQQYLKKVNNPVFEFLLNVKSDDGTNVESSLYGLYNNVKTDICVSVDGNFCVPLESITLINTLGLDAFDTFLNQNQDLDSVKCNIYKEIINLRQNRTIQETCSLFFDYNPTSKETSLKC